MSASARHPTLWLLTAAAIGSLAYATPASAVVCCCTSDNPKRCADAPATATRKCPVGTGMEISPLASCFAVEATARQAKIEKDLKPGWVTAIIGTELIPAGCRVGPQARPQDCDFRSVLQVVVNSTRLILGVVGSLALMMFVYGGFLFLLSGGAAQRVDHAKQVLRNATIGIGVIFLSWTIVNLLLTLLNGKATGER